MDVFERSGDAVPEMCTVELDGATVRVMRGASGEDGSLEEIVCGDEAAAKLKRDLLILELKMTGFRPFDLDAAANAPEPEAAPSPEPWRSEPRHPELEAAILDAPDDDARWGALAERLRADGSARAELITLEIEEADEAEIEAARARAADVVEGGLRPLQKRAAVRIDWERGFVRRMELGSNTRGLSSCPPLADVLVHPSFALAEELALTLSRSDDAEAVIDAIIDAAPSPLRGLSFVAASGNAPENAPAKVSRDLAPWLEAMPRLLDLEVRWLKLPNGSSPLRHDRLRCLRWSSVTMSAEEVRAITTGGLPALERLELNTGEHYFSDAEPAWSIEDLEPVLGGGGFEALAHLAVNGTELDPVATAIAASPLAARLESLDLRWGTLGDAGAAALAGAASGFERLAKLEVGDNRIGPAGVEALREAFGERAEGLDFQDPPVD